MLVLPTYEEFTAFRGADEAPEEADAVRFLEMAAVIIELNLGVTSYDRTTPLGKLTFWAIMDLAWYLGTSMEDRDAMFSPFSSERIGSYSYSKAQRSASNGTALGVPFFDMLLDVLLKKDLVDAAAIAWSNSSKLFETDAEEFKADLHPEPWFGTVVRREDP